MLYSKLGSIPKPETDGTEGWIEVPEAPEAPEGKEVVWWFPPGWVIRDPKPEGDWNWSQSEERWVETVHADQGDITIIDTLNNTSDVFVSAGTVDVSVNLASATGV
jgi:hypothetical protein